MDLGLTEDQEMLRSMAREFIEAEAPRTYVRDMEEDDRGITTDLWQKNCPSRLVRTDRA
jgi:alkylation response protein AidB-like acyl-CoA dehydrogenase